MESTRYGDECNQVVTLLYHRSKFCFLNYTAGKRRLKVSNNKDARCSGPRKLETGFRGSTNQALTNCSRVNPPTYKEMSKCAPKCRSEEDNEVVVHEMRETDADLISEEVCYYKKKSIKPKLWLKTNVKFKDSDYPSFLLEKTETTDFIASQGLKKGKKSFTGRLRELDGIKQDLDEPESHQPTNGARGELSEEPSLTKALEFIGQYQEKYKTCMKPYLESR